MHRFAAYVLLCIFLVGCLSVQDRLRNAESDGRYVDAFWISVEYFNREHTSDARNAMERNANISFERLLQNAESHINNNRFADAYDLFDNEGVNNIQSIVTVAESHDVRILKRERFETVKSYADTRLEPYYKETIKIFEKGNFKDALYRFAQMRGLRESDHYAQICKNEIQYSLAMSEYNAGNFRKAYIAFDKLPSDFKDAAAMRRSSYNRSKIVVALYNFTGDDKQIIKSTIAKVLADEPFIEIMQMNSNYYGNIIGISNENTGIIIIAGAISTNVNGPTNSMKNMLADAWIITGETQTVKFKNGGNGYKRLAKQLSYSINEMQASVKMKIDYQVIDGKTMQSILTNSRKNESSDRQTAYLHNSQYSPELFTVQNPVNDTLNFPITQWQPSKEDQKFQKNFTGDNKLISTEKLLNNAYDDIRFDIAREIRQIIGNRLSEQ